MSADQTPAPDGVPMLSEAMALATKMMRDSWATGNDAAWQPAYQALHDYLASWQQLCADRLTQAEADFNRRLALQQASYEREIALDVAQAVAGEREHIAAHVERNFFSVSRVVKSIRALSAAPAPALPVAPVEPMSQLTERSLRVALESERLIEKLKTPPAVNDSLTVAPRDEQRDAAQEMWVVEWGSVSLPAGHPSRVTCMAIYYSEADAKTHDTGGFDSRVFRVAAIDATRGAG